jgi:hypothetical protein
MKRKIRHAPPMPIEPNERLKEIKTFRRLLVDDFYDYNYRNVYESVFHSRVDTILNIVPKDGENITDKQRNIYRIGNEIKDTNSTEVKMFIAFFIAAEEFFSC